MQYICHKIITATAILLFVRTLCPFNLMFVLTNAILILSGNCPVAERYREPCSTVDVAMYMYPLFTESAVDYVRVLMT